MTWGGKCGTLEGPGSAAQRMPTDRGEGCGAPAGILSIGGFGDMKGIAKPWLFLVMAAVGWIWLNTNAAVGTSALSAVQASQLYDESSFTVLCIIAIILALMWAGIQPALEPLMRPSQTRHEPEAEKAEEKGS
ncbi:MAG: hypothetical protein ACP5UM_09355 [Anaerolineae bacterium]